MSSNFQTKNKNLPTLKVITSKEAFVKNNDGKYKLDKQLDFFGKVKLPMSSVVMKANNKGTKNGFIDDFNKLTKTVKTEVIEHFYDKNGNRTNYDVAYLVRTDNKSKTSNENKEKLKNRSIYNGKTKK